MGTIVRALLRSNRWANSRTVDRAAHPETYRQIGCCSEYPAMTATSVDFEWKCDRGKSYHASPQTYRRS